ncbi:hypothetical protein JHK82_039724 [Glycine max]|nr:hypothetical protein JHK86_039918 [Glycine max]KAG4965524.1 hypothetical protein JHK85_040499 [Glycine max]KAG5110501.1 hypothetical protein JHK82_039724 [Glycine max]KAG5121792.1 hypothetical protein JHK84_040132 [Glycine max]
MLLRKVIKRYEKMLTIIKQIMKVMIRVKSLVGKFMLWLTRTKEDFGIYNDEEDIKGGLNKVQLDHSIPKADNRNEVRTEPDSTSHGESVIYGANLCGSILRTLNLGAMQKESSFLLPIMVVDWPQIRVVNTGRASPFWPARFWPAINGLAWPALQSKTGYFS